MIGQVMLMGIVTKRSILRVEYTIVGRRDRGLGLYDALIDACHKRARPIVMTTVAMIAGMLADCARLRCRRELSAADGHGGDRRLDHIHRAQLAGGAGRFRLCRRRRTLV